MLVLLVVLLESGGWARPPAAVMPSKPTTEAELLEDLLDGRESEQLFAARELRRQARVAVQQLYARDELTALEARQTLARFDETLAPVCMDVLVRPALTAACADILGTLETQAALPALQAALASAERRSARRHLEDAIQAIDQSEGATP